ncbi:large conductance mechanosensitive channel protein MscL [Salinicoccus sp. ID82-1]|uniref:Large-conductance mechanosensitive channel n=1 Tax=Salinicoccus cyprini TaxID=2493691 RepID=A0A558AZI3_9STAP|nr:MULTISPECIES: large conductance mechanosensitive channel protein MscL [Salinicoccus]MCG1009184.1 large conductance mechanosensitive channel protein MscL [Salinicoccus sp. ID82-1]TVT29626.1 large conductance mechanosensitive channel protein MscL [Salinicoccus cyprini]
MWQEFKSFILRGNVIDLAVAVVIGAAFSKIVTALVENIIMPSIALIFGNTDFTSEWAYRGITYGVFIQAIIDFLIIGVAVFAFVKAVNVLTQNRLVKKEEEVEVAEDEQVVLLREIRDALKKDQTGA